MLEALMTDDLVRPFDSAVKAKKLLLGMVHLKPLPGSPRHRGEDLASVAAAARADAETLLAAGFHGYVVENFGDVPFFKDRVPPQVVSFMTRVALELPRQGAIVGVNVLRNDASAALAVAAAANLDFIRVNVHVGAMATDQGIIEGRAARTARERLVLAPGVAILADVDVKHASPVGGAFDLGTTAQETAYRGLADGLIVTGRATGSSVALGDLKTVRAAVPDRPLVAGSGVTPETVGEVLQLADAVIVGTALKRMGRVEEPVDPRRARELVENAG